ncbi:MAG: hypothetical protein IKY04_03485 [Lachnospiraceae bacterium]|nr:hypothetical protein [Lachnospiraceae bacterium]MBR4993291.1 hypothetical protein [Lachnospiraceae bacterium]
MRFSRKPMKAVTMIEIGVAGVLLLVLSLFVFWYVDGLSSFKPQSELHQFYQGAELSFSEDAVFRQTGGDITAQGMPVMETPLLYRGETKITLPCNMLLMVPSEGTKVKRINYFTTVTENAGRATFAAAGKTAQSFGGFLYDGGDLYIFLEPFKLYIGNTSVELPALSYVKVNYGCDVEYHNSETDEDVLMGINDVAVTAQGQSGFVLNLGLDVIYTDIGEALLYSAVDKIAVIEMN